MPHPSAQRRIFLMDRSADSAPGFRQALARIGQLQWRHDLRELLRLLHDDPEGVALLDTRTLADEPSGLVSQLHELRSHRRIGLVTDQALEEYLHLLRGWGLLQIIPKRDPSGLHELEHFIEMIENPASGFGLMRYLSSTIQVFNLAVTTLEDKTHGIERVINHFATCGFDVHSLYNVRLILEELTNNALFHAFRTASGEEKYSISRFERLDDHESVRLEYGSDAERVGFTVTDNAGALPISTVLSKLERQTSPDGLFDDSGRGIYLSRALASQLVINIHHGQRTQFVALFGEKQKTEAIKPLLVNYIGPDSFDEWGLDPDFD